MQLFDLTGKKALVTGGTRGLGHGIAEGLMQAGAEVAVMGTTKQVQTVANQFTQQGFVCHGVVCNLASPAARQQGFEAALSALGGLDILVNCAGIQRRHKSEEFPLADFEEVLNVNLTAPFQLCQMAGNHFIQHQIKGKIINIASMLSFFGGVTIPAYAASKGGIAQLTKALCNEWASKGININAIAPGYMDTEMNTALTNPENPRYQEITNRIPAQRWGTPSDMKGAAVFLASSASDYVNGAIIPVDGGYLVK